MKGFQSSSEVTLILVSSIPSPLVKTVFLTPQCPLTNVAGILIINLLSYYNFYLIWRKISSPLLISLILIL